MVQKRAGDEFGNGASVRGKQQLVGSSKTEHKFLMALSSSATSRTRKYHFPERFNVAEHFVDRHLGEGRGTKIAIRTLERGVSYTELNHNVNRFGNVLGTLGIVPGARVVMVVKDCPEFYYLFWGAVKIGAIPVPANSLLRAQDFDLIINDSQCAGVFYSPEFAREVELAISASAWRPPVALRIEGDDQSLAMLARHASSALQPVSTGIDDDCFIRYTSGTTGQPKGVVHTHRSLVAMCEGYTDGVLAVTQEDVIFCVPRLCFAFGMGFTMMTPLWAGATAVLDDRRQSPATVVEVFERFAPTIFGAVPTFYVMWLASGTLPLNRLAQLRLCISGGETMSAKLHERWYQETGIQIMEALGSTEAGHVFISGQSDDIRPGVTGKPVPGFEMKIVDELGREISDERPGSLFIKGASVMRHYWSNPEKTKEVLVDGWLNTGDTFRRDKEGFYIFCGRGDDMLKVGARWVSPHEVEAVLAEHPMVLEAAVVGHADEFGLVRVKAWVVLRDSANSDDAARDELRAHCKSRLAPYKFPEWIDFVGQLPKTALGKVRRFALRDPTGLLAGRQFIPRERTQ